MNSRFLRRPGLTFAGLAVALLSGCATITTSPSQTVTIDTRPPGAACTLTRGGQRFAIVSPTPGAISVAKSSDAISVSCTREGYLEAAGTLASSFQAMTFGNIIFGGLIGVAVDAVSGAMHEYPPLITITLTPTGFASAAQRDAFFAAMQAEFLKEAAEATARIQKQCSPQSNCESQLKAAEVARQARLAEIEQRRVLATVNAAAAATAPAAQAVQPAPNATAPNATAPQAVQPTAAAPAGLASARPTCEKASPGVDALGGGVLVQCTGLQWTQDDSGRNLTWAEAAAWCARKGRGWRLPSSDELQSLFDASGSSRVQCGTETCKVSPMFRLADSYQWSGESSMNSGAYFFDFVRGRATTAMQSMGRHALCVRGG